MVITPIINGSEGSYIISGNQEIDKYVAQQNVTTLDSLCANDFIFSHWSREVERKAAWMMMVGNQIFSLDSRIEQPQNRSGMNSDNGH